MSDERCFTPLGDDEDGLRVVTAYDPWAGTETVDLAEATEYPLLTTATECGDLCRRMSIMDEHYWPPVNPVPGRVENGKVVALVAIDPLTDIGAEYLRDLATRVGLAYEDAR